MCEPTTIMAIAGAAMSLYQGQQANSAAKKQAAYQRDVGKVNARNQENQAIKTRNKGVEEENRQRAATAQLLGKQRAQLGANGVLLGTGSALQLQEDTTSLGEADALRVRGNYADQAEAIDQGAQNTIFESEAAASNTEAKGQAAFTSGLIGGATAMMPVAGKWYSSKSAATTFAKNNPSAAGVLGNQI